MSNNKGEFPKKSGPAGAPEGQIGTALKIPEADKLKREIQAQEAAKPKQLEKKIEQMVAAAINKPDISSRLEKKKELLMLRQSARELIRAGGDKSPEAIQANIGRALKEKQARAEDFGLKNPEELRQAAEMAKEILNNPEELPWVIEGIVKQIRADQEDARAHFFQRPLEERMYDKGKARSLRQERDDLKEERGIFERLWIETAKKLERGPAYSADNMADYTLAWAFDKELWKEEEKKEIQDLANRYLKLAEAEVKNEQKDWSAERKALLRELIRQVWPRLSVVVCAKPIYEKGAGGIQSLGDYNLDSQAFLGLFELAGIPRKDFPPVLAKSAPEMKIEQGGDNHKFPPGREEKIPGAMMANFGGQEGTVSPIHPAKIRERAMAGARPIDQDFYENLEKEEKILTCDHHASFSQASSSVAQKMYEVLEYLDFFEESDDYFRENFVKNGFTKNLIKDLIEKIVTPEDNKNHPAWVSQKVSSWQRESAGEKEQWIRTKGDWEEKSPRTIFGLLSRFDFFKLLVLAKEMGGPEHFLDELDKERMKGLEGKIKKQYDIDLHLVTAPEKQRSAVEKQKSAVNRARDVSASLRKKGFAKYQNGKERKKSFVYQVNSPDYGQVLFTTGGFPGGIDAIRGLFGPKVLYVIYNAEHKNVFISTAGQTLPPELLDIGFVLRDKMGIVPAGAENFYSMRELLRILNVPEKEIEKNEFLFEARQVDELDKKILEGLAKDFFVSYYEWLEKDFEKNWEKKDPKETLPGLLGDRLAALLQGRIQDYLDLVIQRQKAENLGDADFVKSLADDRQELKRRLLLDYEQKRWPADLLKTDLGPAYNDLFLDLKGRK